MRLEVEFIDSPPVELPAFYRPAGEWLSEGLSPEEPPVAILGVPFDNLTVSRALARLQAMAGSGEPHYVVTANADFLVQARRDPELQRVLQEAHLVLCDGTPLVWASRWLGNPLPERVAGADLLPAFMRIAEQAQYRLFFLGGAPEVAARAVANLRRQFPRLAIVGHFSPPFQPLDQMNFAEISARIRQTAPDFLFVSFGCPKAEKWMARHHLELGVPVAIGVGGTIDFLAGRIRRAPQWLQRLGLEWTFRLIHEPRRLAGRYFNDLLHFPPALLNQWWQTRSLLRRAPDPSPIHHLGEALKWQRIQAPSTLDVRSVRRDRRLWAEIGAAARHCLLELQGVGMIDSTGVALLLRLKTRLQAAGRQLVLVSPSAAVKRVLVSLQLRHCFTEAPNFAAGRRLLVMK